MSKRKAESWATRDCTTDDLRAGRADEIDLAYAAAHIDALEDMNRDLIDALKGVIDLAEEEASSLGELGRDDADTAVYAEEAWTRIERAQAAIAKAEGR